MKDGKAYFSQQEEEISNKYMSANGQSDETSTGSETIKQAGMGAGIFTMIVVLGGAIYLLAKISKQMDKK